MSAQTTHRCPITGCERQVPDDMLLCGRHWRLVSAPLRSRLYRTWNGGRGAGSDAHGEAMQMCIEEVQLTETGAPSAGGYSGTCRACGAAMLWARMPSGRLNPLNVEQVEPQPGAGVVAFNPATGRGMPVINANAHECPRWAQQGATFHTSHFSDCPERQRFRRETAEASA